MDERDRDLLERIVGHAQAAIGYARARGADWASVDETVDAILNRVAQIGELARRLSPVTQVSIPSVPWIAIRGMRNWLVHAYKDVDLVVLKSTIETDLPALVTAVRAALAQQDLPEGG